MRVLLVPVLVGAVVLANASLLVYVRSIEDDADDLIRESSSRWSRLHGIQIRLGQAAANVEEYRRVTDLVGESRAEPVVAASDCGGVLVRFTVGFNRLPQNATVALAYEATRDLLNGTSFRGTGLSGEAREPREVEATRLAGPLFGVEARLADLREYQYRWIVKGDAWETSPPEVLLVGGEARWFALEPHSSRDFHFSGPPDSAGCRRVESASLLVPNPSGSVDRYDLTREASGPGSSSAWHADVYEDLIPEGTWQVEWALTNGTTLRWDLGPRSAGGR